MIAKKLNWSAYFFIGLFGSAIVLGIRAIYMLLTDQIVDENDDSLPRFIVYLICLLFIPVLSSYLGTVWTLSTHMIRHDRTALTIDQDGIHHTIICMNLLALFLVGRIEFIPWHAVTGLDDTDGKPYIRVKLRQIRASRLGKILLFIMGYSFCQGMAKPSFTDEEKARIRQYIQENAPNAIFP